ncbi:MAG: hypothetical protein ACRDKT_16510 [Actinomycetota bacterium]
MPSSINRWAIAGLCVITAMTMILLATTPQAAADHEPAQKVAAAGSDIDQVEDDTPVLTETVRVSSTQDLVLQLTAECSILTALTTNNDNPSSTAFGSVRMRIEIDGTPVAVATDEITAGEEGEGEEDDDPEVGEVTFCNRTYSRTVTDEEDPQDGIDEEDDFIRTRTANAFNWLATDIGFNFDDPANGNNVVEIVVFADYDTDTMGEALADAFVGSRTLIAEPTNASVHEAVEPTGGDGS